MKIVLSTLNSKYIHSNLALRLLQSVTSDLVPCKIQEFTIKEDLEYIANQLLSENVDVIGLGVYIWNVKETMRLIELIKQRNKDILIIVGGPEVSYDALFFMENNKGIDYLISGEGEQSFRQLIQHLQTTQSNKNINIQGVTYRLNDTIHTNGISQGMDLQELITYPSPYRTFTDLENKVIYFESSRGCPYQCAYCLSSLEESVRFFPMEYIKQELQFLIDSNVKTVKFLDRTFNVRKEFAFELFKYIIDHHHPNQVFQFEISGDILHKDIIEYINTHAPKGLIRFEIGIQSTNEETNQLIFRRQNFTKLSNNIKVIQEGNKIPLHLDLIAGLPKETYSLFERTFNDVFALRPQELQLGFLKMLRGTYLRRNAYKWNYIYEEDAPYEIKGNDCITANELHHIHLAEEALEKYWNSHKLEQTMNYIVDLVPSPFSFFHDLGEYWENNNYAFTKYQTIDLFERFYSFIQTLDFDLNVILSLLKYDYLTLSKVRPKRFWDTMNKQERSTLFQDFLQRDDFPLTSEDLYKYSIIEELDFSMSHYLETKEIIVEPQYMIVIYKDYQVSTYFIQK